jgi:hypothetical protein
VRKILKVRLALYLGYLIVASLVGECAFFTFFSMYAVAQGQKPSVVFSADGHPADMTGFTDFKLDGPEPDPQSAGVDANEYFSVSEMAAYLRLHRAAGAGERPVRVEITLYTARFDDAARQVVLENRVLCRGFARAVR